VAWKLTVCVGHESQLGLLAGETTFTLWKPPALENVSLTLTIGVVYHGFPTPNREGPTTKSSE